MNSSAVAFAGNQTLNGTGTVVFAGAPIPFQGCGSTYVAGLFAFSGGTLTLGPGITVRGAHGMIGGFNGGCGWNFPASASVINQGTILSDTTGGLINIVAQPFINQGTVQGTLGSLSLQSPGGSITNLGTLQGGAADLFVTGTLLMTNGQTLLVNGGTLSLQAVTMSNGTITTTNGGSVNVLTSTGQGHSVFDGVTVNGTMSVGGYYTSDSYSVRILQMNRFEQVETRRILMEAELWDED